MKKTPHNIEPPVERKKSRVARVVRSDDVPAPSREEARRRVRSRPGFFESLPPAARAAIESDDGPEAIGPAPKD